MPIFIGMTVQWVETPIFIGMTGCAELEPPLKLGVFRRPGERNHIADIAHPGHKKNKTLKA